MPIVPFAVQASAGCPPHGALLLGLAAEFTEVDERAVEERLDGLATSLAPLRSAYAPVQLAALGVVLFKFQAATDPIDLDDLLLPAVLERGSGDPAVLAAIGAEVGRRAGMAFGVLSEGCARVLVGRRGRTGPLALDPTTSRPVGRGTDRQRLTWRCAHQVAFLLLGRIGERAAEARDLAAAERAARMRLALPVDHATRARLDQELAAALDLGR